MPKEPYSFNAFVLYSDLRWEWSLSYQDIGKNFNPAVGFVPRVGYKRLNPDVSYVFYPKSGWINRHGPFIELEGYWNDDLGMTDRDINLGYLVRFNSLSELVVFHTSKYLQLMNDFTPTRTGGEQLLAGSEVNTNSIGLQYASNPRNAFNVRLDAEAGQYFTGNFQQIASEMTVRMGCRANISMNFNYAKIRLPEPQIMLI